jgi:hypothetical protein
LGGIPIPEVESLKYLGFWLDKSLRWNIHVDKVIQKAKRQIFLVTRIIGKYWGPTPKMMIWLWDGVIKPIICYGALIWGTKIEQDLVISKLNKLYRLLFNKIAPFRKSTPTSALQVLLNTPPPDFEIKAEIIREFWNNIELCLQGQTFNITSKSPNITRYALEIQNLDLVSLERQGFELSRPNFQKFKYEGSGEVDVSEIFKRGPCSVLLQIVPQQGGSTGQILLLATKGNELQLFNFQLSYPNYTNKTHYVNLALLWECLRLVTEFISNQFFTTNFSVQIWTNENFDLSLLQNNLCSVTLLKQLARNIASSHLLSSVLCRRASSVQLARVRDIFAGTDPVDIQSTILPPLTKYSMAQRGLSRLKNIWFQSWLKRDTCRQTKLIIGQLDPTVSKYIRQLDRDSLGRVIRFITGHAYLPAHNQVVNSNLTDNLCRYCNQGPETVTHILFECPKPTRMAARAQHIQVYIADSDTYTEFYSVSLVNLILDNAFKIEVHT